jgi:hypothetical protein
VFLLPIGVGLLAGIASRRAAPARYRFSAALATAVSTAALTGLLAFLSGGRLATGPFDPVRLPVELLVPAVLLWVGVPIMLIAVLRTGPAGPDGPGDEDDRLDGHRDEAAEEAGGDGADAASVEPTADDPDGASRTDTAEAETEADGDADEAGADDDLPADQADGERAETSTDVPDEPETGDEPAGQAQAPAGQDGAQDRAVRSGDRDGGGKPERAARRRETRGDKAPDRAVPRRIPAARRSPEPVEPRPRRRWWRRDEPQVEPLTAVPEQRGPQTVAELVAQRAEESTDREESERRDDV